MKLWKRVKERKKNNMFGLFSLFITSILCSFAALSSAPLDNAANEQVDKPIQDLGYQDEYGNQIYLTYNDFIGGDFIINLINYVAPTSQSYYGRLGFDNTNTTPNTAYYNVVYEFDTLGYFYDVNTTTNILEDTYTSTTYNITKVILERVNCFSMYNVEYDEQGYRYEYSLTLRALNGDNHKITYTILRNVLSMNGHEIDRQYQVVSYALTNFPSRIGPGAYFYYYENDLDGQSFFVDYYLKPYLNSISQDYQSGYGNGLSDGISQGYNKGYNVGFNDGYAQGDNDGYARGYPEGVLYGQSQDETAVTIFSGILNIALVPINFFLAILNFEVFGVNIGAFVSALLTIAIVVIIIRMILGGKSDDK